MAGLHSSRIDTAPQRWDVINALLLLTDRRRFLEIGVQNGSCGQRVRAAEKWGVDPGAVPNAKKFYKRLILETSDQFFSQLLAEQQFDVVLVDGLHHAEQVLRDVDNALRHLAPDGFIVLHDCNPQSEIAQRVPRASGVWNGDCWKAMVALRQRTDLDAFTIDTDHGVGVVQRRANPRPPDVSGALTYADLAANRERFLGLIPPTRWRQRLGGDAGIGKLVVVSAVFGARDVPAPIRDRDASDYIMFTDGSPVPGWNTVHLTAPGDPRASARRVKTLALELVPDADTVLWIDGRIRPTGQPLRPLLAQALADTDIASFPHPWRDCVYTEARECVDLGRADAGAMAAQIAEYRAAGLPEKVGLFNTMVVARRRTEAMIEFGRAWWEEICRHTQRDQVSLPFLLWKRGIVCGKLGHDVYAPGSSPYFNRGHHARARG